MTSAETKTVLALLRAAYPSFYAGMSIEQLRSIVNLWQQMFADDPFPRVAAAVKALIATKADSYPPVIGAVKAKLADLIEQGGMTEQEAWALVSHAISNGIYGSKKEFEALPPDVQRVVGTPEQIASWAMVSEREVQTVIASNFMRSYKIRANRTRELSMLPADVKALIAPLAEKLKLGGEGNNPQLPANPQDDVEKASGKTEK